MIKRAVFSNQHDHVFDGRFGGTFFLIVSILGSQWDG
jgi:hypothetical protein